jgi:hypothetical protein
MFTTLNIVNFLALLFATCNENPPELNVMLKHIDLSNNFKGFVVDGA